MSNKELIEKAEAFSEKWEGKSVDDVDTQPTQEMADIASTVLEKIDDPDLDNDDCGTRTGLERANQLENREDLSPDTIGRMVSFFARHDGNQEVDEADNKWEDCGFVAWQLWGGDPGREWAERKMEEIEEAEEDPDKQLNDIMSPEQDDKDTQKKNQLSKEELKKISEKAGTDDAPKVHKGFQINSKDIKQGEDEDGNPVYKVPISGDAMDRDRDQMAIEGQEHMVEQLRSGKVPVYGDHGRAADAPRYSFTNIIGQFIDGQMSEIENQEINEGDKVTLATMRVREEHPDGKELVKLLEGDWPVGFSVGFRPLKVEEITNDEGELVGLKMLEIDLLEASAVGIPSQPDSVPVGISTNSTQAAVAVKSVLDKADGDVDIDELKDSLSKSMLKGEQDMGDQNDDKNDGSGDEPEENDSKPEEQNQAEQLKGLVKEALEEHERQGPHYVKTLEESLKEVEKFDDEELEEIMSVVTERISTHMDAAMEDIAEELALDEGDGDGDGEEENEMDEDEEDEEENSGEPDEEDEMDEDEEEDDDDKGLDEDQMTDPDKSEGPKGTGPMTTDGEKGEDGPEDVELSDELSEDELEELGFGGRP